ncbi:FAD-linked oxidase C-terminal domain-containing protein [Polyangium sp. 15x6]|uniref:FAD-binding oxidoreductase n=1 Tax=Polyangium sp. 15x6 TaxID=3042687 RepID=UPI00249C60B7|nr:FAD-linked oxidase C-terminal domain-containing protein [Polyangium sp. 15x6]MDI3291365.1 FAD-linked oxidase C-terminal domain-containing protein [Polyangium sp. 15x6]
MLAHLDLGALLERHLGADRVRSDAEALARYARDASSIGPFPPEAVVFPSSAEEISVVLRLAYEHGFPVTPRGAGTGLSGGALPVCGGVVLSTERMQQIKEIDDVSFTAVVEPGVVTGALQQALEAQGLFYPPDPASLGTCSIGGNVAHNAGGPRALKYGVTRDYVLGLDTVLPGGMPLRMGRRTMKGVVGHDVTALFVGSEGTLGVTTKVTLRVIPAPRAWATHLSIFRTAVDAGRAVTQILRSGFRPSALELLDGPSISVLRLHGNHAFPPGAGAILLCEMDEEFEALDRVLSLCSMACAQAGAIEQRATTEATERARLWSARRAVYPLLVATFPRIHVEDVCVPRGRIPEALRRLDMLAAQHRIPTATIAHAGDGNLHVGLLRGAEPDRDGTEDERLERMRADLLRDILRLGGTIAGEHGIGYAKRHFLGWELSPEMIALQRKLKMVFDPKHLLNPGKIFSEA